MPLCSVCICRNLHHVLVPLDGTHVVYISVFCVVTGTCVHMCVQVCSLFSYTPSLYLMHYVVYCYIAVCISTYKYALSIST